MHRKTTTEKRHNKNNNSSNGNDDKIITEESSCFFDCPIFVRFFPLWFSISTSSFHWCEFLIIIHYVIFSLISLAFCFYMYSVAFFVSLYWLIFCESIMCYIDDSNEFDVVDELAKLYTMHWIMLCYIDPLLSTELKYCCCCCCCRLVFLILFSSSFDDVCLVLGIRAFRIDLHPLVNHFHKYEIRLPVRSHPIHNW